MKATVTRKELYEGLRIAARVASKQTTLPTLKNVLIEAGTDSIKLSTTDLEMSAELIVPATVTEAGSVLVPAKGLLDRIALLPEADVSLASTEGRHLQIECRRLSSLLHGGDPEEFVALPEVMSDASFSIAQSLLREMIGQTIFAAIDDSTRPVMMSVCFTVERGVLRLAATDTHRLAVRKSPVSDATGDVQAIVPERTIAEIAAALNSDADALAQVSFDANQVQVKTDTATLSSRLICGQYPRIERIIPGSSEKRWTVNRDDLMAAIRRVRLSCEHVRVDNKESCTERVVLEAVGELLSLSAQGREGNSVDELEIEREGDEISLAMNAKYMLDVLGAMKSESVRVEITSPLSPVVFRPVNGDDYLCIVMPMQQQ